MADSPETDQTPAHVAELATQAGDLPVRGLALLGTYLADDIPRALIRLTSGGIVRVALGDEIIGRRVAIILDGSVALQKGRTFYWLDMA